MLARSVSVRVLDIWRVESTYYFVNGFAHTELGNGELFTFHKN
jgi:hypothetical protein